MSSNTKAVAVVPVRRAYSREEMIEAAKAYMVKTFGPSCESGYREEWYANLGLLVDFIGERFPSGGGGVE